MKKTLILFVITFFSLNAMADMPIHFGFHVGTSANRIKLKDLSQIKDSKDNIGFMLGAFARLNIGKRTYLEPALNFSHEISIAERKKTDTRKGKDIQLKINTVDVPVMIGWDMIRLAVAKIRVYTGPQLSVGNIKNLKKLTEEPIKIDKVTVRGKIGLGVDIGNLTFDADYEKGFKKMSNELKAPRSFNLTVGFKFM